MRGELKTLVERAGSNPAPAAALQKIQTPQTIL